MRTGSRSSTPITSASGPAWSAAGPLRIGLGAKANVPVAGQQITLATLARLLQIAGTVTPQLGQVTFAGTFPVPDFLSGGEITGEVGTATNTVGLKASRTPSDFRQLDYPNTVIAWDAARLAVFVLKAWIAQRAAANEEFFKRINDHLFPMLGDPAGAIAPFPLVAPMKAPPNFDAWRGSVLTTDNNASGALTFLWHARALLTGNEDPNFLNGSFFFPLSGAPQAGSPPTLANAAGNYTRPTNTTGAWVGLLTPPDEPANTFTLVLDLETAAASARGDLPHPSRPLRRRHLHPSVARRHLGGHRLGDRVWIRLTDRERTADGGRGRRRGFPAQPAAHDRGRLRFCGLRWRLRPRHPARGRAAAGSSCSARRR